MDLLTIFMMANSVLLLLTLVLLVALSRKKPQKINQEKTNEDMQRIKEQII